MQGKGYTFATISKNEKGEWSRNNNVTYEQGLLKWGFHLPLIETKRKVFVSYFHDDDQIYRERFENLISDLIVTKSVKLGDIKTDLRQEYIKRLIQDGYLADTSVIVVLVGENTKNRKHVDWEISGALNFKVGNSYAGLLGILLPTHPDYGRQKARFSNLPERLSENFKTGYANIIDYTTSRHFIQKWIEDAFEARTSRLDKIVNKALIQRVRNS